MVGRRIVRRELLSHCEPLSRELGALYAGAQIETARLSAAVPGLDEAWQDFLELHPVSDLLQSRVQNLLERDGEVAISLCHGDLVPSDMIVTESSPIGVVLIDWEHAKRRPAGTDLAKLQLYTRDTEAALRVFQRTVGDLLERDARCFSLAEQIAVAHIQMLGWHRHRLERARRAGRLEALVKDTRERLAVLDSLLR